MLWNLSKSVLLSLHSAFILPHLPSLPVSTLKLKSNKLLALSTPFNIIKESNFPLSEEKSFDTFCSPSEKLCSELSELSEQLIPGTLSSISVRLTPEVYSITAGFFLDFLKNRFILSSKC
ncbi:UNVERIFIED_CONTAM: hypothetical protein RMT77_003501 [Armadillidium vulgare]